MQLIGEEGIDLAILPSATTSPWSRRRPARRQADRAKRVVPITTTLRCDQAGSELLGRAGGKETAAKVVVMKTGGYDRGLIEGWADIHPFCDQPAQPQTSKKRRCSMKRFIAILVVPAF